MSWESMASTATSPTVSSTARGKIKIHGKHNTFMSQGRFEKRSTLTFLTETADNVAEILDNKMKKKCSCSLSTFCVGKMQRRPCDHVTIAFHCLKARHSEVVDNMGEI